MHAKSTAPLLLDGLVNIVVALEIPSSTRQNMDVHVRHRLPGMQTILHRYVESLCVVSILEPFADEVDGSVQIDDFIGGEFVKPRSHTFRKVDDANT